MKKLSFNLQLLKSISTLSKRIMKKEDEFLSKFGLSHFHAKYLGQLNLHDELTMVELTEMIGVDKANTTRVIRDLIDKDYVEKSGGERKFKLHLTSLGKTVAESFNKNLCSFMKDVMGEFSPADHENLNTLLEKLFKGVMKYT